MQEYLPHCSREASVPHLYVQGSDDMTSQPWMRIEIIPEDRIETVESCRGEGERKVCRRRMRIHRPGEW